MNNNDLIRREDVFQELDSFLAEVEGKMLSILEQYGACANRAVTNCEETAKGAVNNIRKRINAIPAVPQPMSAVEYEIAKDRWSKWCYSQFSGQRSGKSCKDARCEYIGKCLISQSSPGKRVSFIEKWAQEHPERSEE